MGGSKELERIVFTVLCSCVDIVEWFAFQERSIERTESNKAMKVGRSKQGGLIYSTGS